MKKKSRNNLIQGVLTSCFGILAAFILWQTGLLTGWENRAWDMQTRVLARPSSHTSEITLVLLDQASLEWVQENMGISWPWPRELYGAILDNTRRHQALGVGFDVLFTEPSSYGVSDDAALGAAIAATNHFAAGSVFPGKTGGKYDSWPENADRPSFMDADTIPENHGLPSYGRATLPIPEVSGSSSILCSVHQDPGEDGIYRSLYPLVFFDNVPLPALGLGIYLAVNPEISVSFEDNKLVVGDCPIPLDDKGRALIRFRGPAETYNRLSAASLLREELLLREDESNKIPVNKDLKGKYVLFGFSAPGLFDLRPTPVGGIFSGVEINATLLDNLLSRDFISPVNTKKQAVVIVLITLLGGLLFAWFCGPMVMSAMSLVFVVLPPVFSLVLHHFGYRFEVMPFEVAVVITIMLGYLLGYIREGRQRQFIKHSFKHYLSPQVIEQLIQDPDRLKLGGERKELTIFFSDLEGFTTISENLDPDQLIGLLNDYLSAMTDIILEEKGTIDKYEGDAIIAFWNAPMETEDHALRAVSAALRCQAKLAELRPLFKKQCGHDMYMRIGLNSGPAVVGNLGSASRFDYSMLGDAVNLAARLEGANKQFASYNMISDSTYKLIRDDFPCRELARLTVVGRKEPVRVHEPFLAEDWKKDEEKLLIFLKGLRAWYAGDFAAAIGSFEKIAAQDPPAQKYLERCQQQETSSENWTGIWGLTSK